MAKNWFVHIQGENLGPLTPEALTAMLKQNRIQFSDFAWHEGLTRWVRISELDEFISLMPTYPKTSIPELQPSVTTPKVRCIPEDLQPEQARDVMAINKTEKKTPTPTQTWTKVRGFERVFISGKLHIETHGTFDIINLSEGGVFLKTTSTIPPLGEELKFEIESQSLGKKLTSMTGVIIRQGIALDNTGFAIEFTRLNPAYKRILRDYIQKTKN